MRGGVLRRATVLIMGILVIAPAAVIAQAGNPTPTPREVGAMPAPRTADELCGLYQQDNAAAHNNPLIASRMAGLRLAGSDITDEAPACTLPADGPRQISYSSLQLLRLITFNRVVDAQGDTEVFGGGPVADDDPGRADVAGIW